MSQTLTNSYSGDSAYSAFNELSSVVSSPVSTPGTSDAIEGVNVPMTARQLRKKGRNEEGGDEDSVRSGRKRFSRRHSRNGLAAVF